LARNSVKIGIVMLILWVVPFIGLMLAVAGLVLGIVSYSNLKDDMARAGIFMNSLGFGLSVLNLSVSLYLLLSGELDISIFFDQLNGLD